MDQNIKILFCQLLFFASPFVAFSQPLSPQSKEVKAAWEALNKQPDSKQLQLAYLKVFPSNKRDFVAVFEPDDFKQLYSGGEKYIDSFAALAKNYPGAVIDKSINIGKDLQWEADGIGQLQGAIVVMGVNNTIIFSKRLKLLTVIQQSRLIKFLADEDGIKHDQTYQELINGLIKIGEKALAHKFEIARTEREKEKE